MGRETAELRQAQQPEDEGSRDLALQRLRLDAAKALLDKQIESNETLDRGRADTVRAGSFVLPLTVALLQFARDPATDPAAWQLAIFWCLLALGFLSFVAILFCSYVAKRLDQLQYRPRLITLGERVSDWAERPTGETRATRWLANEYTDSTNKNLPTLTTKAKWVGLSETFLYAEVVFLATSVVPMLLA